MHLGYRHDNHKTYSSECAPQNAREGAAGIGVGGGGEVFEARIYGYMDIPIYPIILVRSSSALGRLASSQSSCELSPSRKRTTIAHSARGRRKTFENDWKRSKTSEDARRRSEMFENVREEVQRCWKTLGNACSRTLQDDGRRSETIKNAPKRCKTLEDVENTRECSKTVGNV